MALHYSCFISYRHTPYLGERIKQLIKDLKGNIDLEFSGTGLEVFWDEKDISSGQKIDQRIQKAICQSVCMIVIYTPNYFSKTHPYCARELQAILEIERQRSEQVPLQNGLIIPIIYRCQPGLEPDLLRDRSYKDIRPYTAGRYLGDSDQTYNQVIQDLAVEVNQLYRITSSIQTDCNDFILPQENDPRVQQLIRENQYNPSAHRPQMGRQ